MEINEDNNLPTLVSHIRLDQQQLSLEYRIKNTTDMPIYIFNILWDVNESGEFIAAEKQLYVNLQDEETLVLAKKIPKLPTLQSVEFREIPYVTKLEKGEEYKDKIILKVPIEEFNPYFPKAENSKTEVKTAQSVKFEIQFIREIDGLELKKTAIENAWSVWHQDLFGNIETLLSKPTPIEVKVDKRLDEFDEI